MSRWNGVWIKTTEWMNMWAAGMDGRGLGQVRDAYMGLVSRLVV